jgi:hypothetical protein
MLIDPRTDTDRLSVSLHVRACAGGLVKPVLICPQTGCPGMCVKPSKAGPRRPQRPQRPASASLRRGWVGTGPAPKRISGGPLSHGEAIEIKSNDEESL